MQAVSREEGEPVSKPSKDSKYGPHWKNVVKVSHYVVGIMKNNVNRGIGENNTCKSPQREQKYESQGS